MGTGIRHASAASFTGVSGCPEAIVTPSPDPPGARSVLHRRGMVPNGVVNTTPRIHFAPVALSLWVPSFQEKNPMMGLTPPDGGTNGRPSRRAGGGNASR